MKKCPALVFLLLWGSASAMANDDIQHANVAQPAQMSILQTLELSINHATLTNQLSLGGEYWAKRRPSNTSKDSKKEQTKKYLQIAGMVLAVPGGYLAFHEGKNYGHVMFLSGMGLLIVGELL